MDAFPSSVYRGFVAKQIPGSAYWQSFRRSNPDGYRRTLEDPAWFMNKGYETLANSITHPDQESRKLINYTGIKVSYEAHKRGQLQGSHTLPVVDGDGTEVLDERAYDLFVQTIDEHLPESLRASSLSDYVENAAEINRFLPRDT